MDEILIVTLIWISNISSVYNDFGSNLNNHYYLTSMSVLFETLVLKLKVAVRFD